MKLRKSAAVILALLVGYSCATVVTNTEFQLPYIQANRDTFESGINLYLNRYDYSADTLLPKTGDLLDELEDLGITSLSLVWPIYMDDISSTRIYEGAKTPSKEEIRQVVLEAHNRGFEVTLRPTIDEESFGYPDWRGTIRPSNIAGWFQSYTSLIYDYALLAEVTDVHRLSVGVELTSLENQTGHWVTLTSMVRGVYSGELIYASNRGISETFDWSLVDIIGVDAFFESVVPDDASLEEHTTYLTRNWATSLIPYEDKPVVISEAGVISRAGAFRAPWQWTSSAPIDQEAQIRYLAAFCRAFSPYVEGIHWWKATLNPVTPGGFEIIGLQNQSVLTCIP